MERRLAAVCLLVYVLVAVACSSVPQDPGVAQDSEVTPDPGPAADTDGDGHPQGVDCDDDDPDVFPGAREVCDSVDNDCDGAVPELAHVDPDDPGCSDTAACELGGRAAFCTIRRALECLAGPRQRLTNGGFETKTDGGPADWSSIDPDPDDGSGWSTSAESHFGESAMRLHLDASDLAAGLDPNGLQMVQDPVPVAPGPHRIGAWFARRSSGSRMKYIQVLIQVRDGAGELLGVGSADQDYVAFYPQPARGWTWFESPIVVLPEGSESLHLRLRAICTAGDDCPRTDVDFLVDDIGLEPVPDWSFEEDTDNDAVPDAWIFDGPTVSWDSSRVLRGHRAVAVGAGGTLEHRPFPVRPTRYTLSTWVRGEGLTGGSRVVLRYLLGGDVVGEDQAQVPDGSYDWQQLDVIGTRADGFDSVVAAVVVPDGSSGVLRVDGLDLFPVTGSDPLCLLVATGTSPETCLSVPISGSGPDSEVIIRPELDGEAIFEAAAGFECQRQAVGSPLDLIGDNAVFRVPGQRYVAFEDLVIRPADRIGVLLGMAGTSPRHVDHARVSRCSFETDRTGGALFMARGLRYSAVSDSTFRGGKYAFWLAYHLPSYGNLIERNHFTGQRGGKTMLVGFGLDADHETRTRVVSNVFEDGSEDQLYIDSWASHVEVRDNTFVGGGGAIELNGHDLTFIGNRVEGGSSGVQIRQESDARPWGEVDELLSPTEGTFVLGHTMGFPIPSSVHEARVVRVRTLDGCSKCTDELAPVMCDWASCDGYEIRELTDYERLSPTRARFAVNRPFDEPLTEGDHVFVSDMNTDIVISDNTFTSMGVSSRKQRGWGLALNASAKAELHLYELASYRRVEFSRNLIVDSPRSRKAAFDPTNPSGAISLWGPSEGFRITGNVIRGGHTNGIVLRQFDKWQTEVPHRDYEVVISGNCITPRDEGWYGVVRKEARPPNATLTLSGNRYGGVWDDWGADQLDVIIHGHDPERDWGADPDEIQLQDYADRNDAAYAGGCEDGP